MLGAVRRWFAKQHAKRGGIEGIQIKKEVLTKICDMSSSSHPYEFLAFLEGKIKNNKIVVEDLIFQPYKANTRSALPRIELPLTTKTVGSVHSHPGPSNRPSRADRHFFHKTGIVHGIICNPYKKENFELYDLDGNPLSFEEI